MHKSSSSVPRFAASRFLLVFACCALIGVTYFAGPVLGAQGPKGPPTWVQDELLVGLRPGVSRAQAEAIYRIHGATLLEEIPQIRVHRIRVPAAALPAVEQALSRLPAVRFVDKNYIVPPDVVPNDPAYPNAWHLPMIAAPQAWDISQGTPGVVIAILDSGVDPTHPDLATKLVPGYNFYDRNTNTSDVYGHGTIVAGAAAATTDNGIGVAGVAWQNRVMPIRITDTAGWGYYSTIAQGLTWAVDKGAKVMNLSFSPIAGSSTITSAAQYVVSKGGLVVASAGNCGCVEATPDNPYIILVSATASNDNLAGFSSYGAYVDVSAPGAGIWSTTRGGGYGAFSGTSVSSPVAAGVLALMMSAKPGLTPADYETILKKNADDRGTAGYDISFGWGRVNAFRAVAAAAGFAPQPDKTAPTVKIDAPLADSTVSGMVKVDVSATDNVGVTGVDLYVDGVLLATALSAPTSFYWDTSGVADGAHALVAKARDAAGNIGTSQTVTVTVRNGSDGTPPNVTISSVTLNKNLLKVSVTVQDDGTVTRVELYVDGQLVGTDYGAPYDFNVNIRKLPAGNYVLEARAYDASGKVGTAQSSFGR